MSNTTENATIEIAAFVVERAVGGTRGTVAGLLIQPVVWAVSDDSPDAADAFIYAVGGVGAFAGSLLLSVPALVTGGIKAYVDDQHDELVEQARLDEPEAVRSGIHSVKDFSFFSSSSHNEAMAVASAGGVTWQHPNGAQLYIKDASDNLICDYHPRRFVRAFMPHIPVRLNGTAVRWRTVRP